MELLIDGKWNEVKGKLKKKYADLTDNDLMYQKGMEDELFGRIEKKIGKSKTQVRQEIEALIN